MLSSFFEGKKKLLLFLNIICIVIVLAIGAQYFLLPKISIAYYGNDYKNLMFKCDNAMREHFITKQLVKANPSDQTIKNLESSEVALLDCHDYDKLRKKLLAYGLSEAQLSIVGLDALEAKSESIRDFVDIHEIRY
jgi:hypothetical protein